MQRSLSAATVIMEIVEVFSIALQGRMEDAGIKMEVELVFAIALQERTRAAESMA